MCQGLEQISHITMFLLSIRDRLFCGVFPGTQLLFPGNIPDPGTYSSWNFASLNMHNDPVFKERAWLFLNHQNQGHFHSPSGIPLFPETFEKGHQCIPGRKCSYLTACLIIGIIHVGRVSTSSFF